ncbi:MAG: anti-sigma F factor antagonist [Clostridiales bacterium]|nr:anti-sigma F factor antagonist [Clostridiales bacterium]
MELTANITGNILICRVKGELDHHTAEEFRTFVDYNMENNPVKHLLLDLTHLSFMDSSGIGALIGRYKKVSSTGGRVMVVNENKQVSRVFEVSGIYEIIKSYSSISKAINDI